MTVHDQRVVHGSGPNSSQGQGPMPATSSLHHPLGDPRAPGLGTVSLHHPSSVTLALFTSSLWQGPLLPHCIALSVSCGEVTYYECDGAECGRLMTSV